MGAQLQPSPDRSVACRACGYDLRGIDRGSACPECATAVAWSIDGYRLRAGSPFVRWVRAGAFCATVAPVLFLASLLTASSRIPDSWQVASQNLGVVLMLASGVFLVVGAWLLLSRDASEPAAARRPGLMWFGRAAVVAIVMVPALATLKAFLRRGLSDSAGTMFLAVELLLLGAVVFAMGTQARRIASRLDAPRLQIRANRARWLLAAAFAMVGGLLIWPAPGRGAPPGPPGLAAVLALLMLVATVMFFGTLASLLARLRPGALKAGRADGD